MIGGLVAEFRSISQFVPSLEVSVERLHAQLTQNTKTGKHFSPGFLSMTSRRQEINAAIEDSATECALFLNEFGKVWNAARCLETFGLRNHPSVAHALKPDGSIE